MKHLLSCLLLTSFLTGIAGAAGSYPFAGGIIVRLDVEAQQITIKTAAGPKNFLITDQTYLLNGAEKLTFNRLKLGDAIKINYYTNEAGRALIRRLKIAHPPTDDMVDKTK